MGHQFPRFDIRTRECFVKHDSKPIFSYYIKRIKTNIFLTACASCTTAHFVQNKYQRMYIYIKHAIASYALFNVQWNCHPMTWWQPFALNRSNYQTTILVQKKRNVAKSKMKRETQQPSNFLDCLQTNRIEINQQNKLHRLHPSITRHHTFFYWQILY